MEPDIKPEDRVVLDSLSKAVVEALDRKRRLGQYAVVQRNGKTVKVPPEELPSLEPDSK